MFLDPGNGVKRVTATCCQNRAYVYGAFRDKFNESGGGNARRY